MLRSEQAFADLQRPATERQSPSRVAKRNIHSARLFTLVRVSGWSAPKTRSWLASARRYSGNAPAVSPSPCRQVFKDYFNNPEHIICTFSSSSGSHVLLVRIQFRILLTMAWAFWVNATV